MSAGFPVGNATRKFDDKGRVQFTARQADDLQRAVVMCPGIGPFIEVYSEEGWARYRNQLLQAADRGPLKYRTLLRHVLGRASNGRIDQQYRLVLPRELVAWAQIDSPPDGETREVIVVGVGECVEIWRPDLFEAQMKTVEADLEALCDEMRASVSMSAGTPTPTVPQGSDDD
ncbi:MAG: division/cell wall cluster transcriptional repressor MraZ [Candidatus Zipacnadales bacterium]